MRSVKSEIAFKSDSLLNSRKQLLRKLQGIFESLNFCDFQTKNCKNVLIIGSSTVAFLFFLTFLVFGRVGFGTGFFRNFDLGTRERHFQFLAKSKNPENCEIPEIGIGIQKILFFDGLLISVFFAFGNKIPEIRIF